MLIFNLQRLPRLIIACLCLFLLSDRWYVEAGVRQAFNRATKSGTTANPTTTTARPATTTTTARTTTTASPTTTTARPATTTTTAKTTTTTSSTTTTAFFAAAKNATPAATTTTTTAISINDIAYAQSNSDARIALFDIGTPYATASSVASKVIDALAASESMAADRVSTVPSTLGDVHGYVTFATTCGLTNTNSFASLNNGLYQYTVPANTKFSSLFAGGASTITILSGVVSLINFASGSTGVKTIKIQGTVAASKFGDITIPSGSALSIVVQENKGILCSVSIGDLNPSGDKTLNLSNTVLYFEKKPTDQDSPLFLR